MLGACLVRMRRPLPLEAGVVTRETYREKEFAVSVCVTHVSC